MVLDTPFSSSVLVVVYSVDDHDWCGIPQRIDSAEPFPLRETMLTTAREVKVVTDVSGVPATRRPETRFQLNLANLRERIRNRRKRR